MGTSVDGVTSVVVVMVTLVVIRVRVDVGLPSELVAGTSCSISVGTTVTISVLQGYNVSALFQRSGERK